jgi:hypothetical protein
VIDLDYAEDDVEDIMKEIAILAQLNSKYVTRSKLFFSAYAIGTLARTLKGRNFGLSWNIAAERAVLIWSVQVIKY